MLWTARLHLRPIRVDDADAWHDAVFADPEVMRSLPSGASRPRGEMAARNERHLDHWREDGFGLLAVTDRDEGSFLGHCGLRVVEEWPGDVEVLYAIARSHWGRGSRARPPSPRCGSGSSASGLSLSWGSPCRRTWPRGASSSGAG